MSRHRGRETLGWPHLVTWAFMFAALIVGVTLNQLDVRDRARLEQENCRAILTLSRNLFYPLPIDEKTSPELRYYTQELLAGLYRHQYMQLDKTFRLEERCGGGLPKGTPPPPPRLDAKRPLAD